MQNQEHNYPTEWQGGISRGSIKEQPNFYRAVISPPKEKQYDRVFYFTQPKRRSKNITDEQIFNNKPDAMKAAKKFILQESDIEIFLMNKLYEYGYNTI